MKVGDVTVKNIPLGTIDNPLLDLILDGILGPSLLADFIITMDYPRSQIELSQESAGNGHRRFPCGFSAVC